MPLGLAYVAREEGLELRGDGAALLARLADGGLRDALSLLDQCAVTDRPIGEQEVLDALGLAGNLETAALMEQIGGGDTAGALETLGRLYGAGKEVGSLLGELASLTRDLLVRKTAPQGGAALLTGGYDENTMRRLSNVFQTARLVQVLGLLQSTIADLPRSGNRRTDAELCLIRLCQPALDESLTGLNVRLSRVEELLAGGVPSVCAVPAAPLKRNVPEQKPAGAPAAEELPPWEEERPPLPEEPPEEPEHPSAVVEEPAKNQMPRGAAQRSGGGDIWPGLVVLVRNKFPAVYPFLSNPAAVQGRLEDGVLTLWVDNEFTKNMVGGAHILAELARLASEQTGSTVRCAVKVGKAPEQAPQAPAEHDNLDDLLAMGQQFDNIIIEE